MAVTPGWLCWTHDGERAYDRSVNGQDDASGTDSNAASEPGVARLRLVAPLADTDEEEPGGDPVCWAHLVCEECGAITTEGHRGWCSR
jgi:hypothetical protein